MKSCFAKILFILSIFFVGTVSAYGSVLVGTPVTFRGQSEDNARFNWKFSDGDTATGQVVEHTFTQAGVYQVTLIVTKDDKVNSITKKVRVLRNQAPAGHISANKTAGMMGETFWFLADYTDLEKDALSYQWIIEDAFSLEPEGLISSEDQSVSHVFSGPGRFRVKVMVRDGFSERESSLYVNILAEEEVINRAPVGKISFNKSSGTTDDVFWFFADFSDPEKEDLSYVWTIEDAFSFEKEMVDSATSASLSHSFSQPGRFRVKVTVRDASSATESLIYVNVLKVEEVVNRPPFGKVSANRSAGTTDDTFWFVANFADPEQGVLSYQWEIKDAFSYELEDIVSSGKETLSHTFSKPGRFQVTVSVSDNVSSHDEMLYVDIAAPTEKSNASSLGKIVPSKSSGPVDETFWFFADYTDPEKNTLTYVWKIENAFSLDPELVASSTNQSISHVFSEPGRFRVSVSVDDTFSTREDSVHINVLPKKEFINGKPLGHISVNKSLGTTEDVFWFLADYVDPDGDPLSFMWLIEEAFSRKEIVRSTEPSLTHIFSIPGLFRVHLAVKDPSSEVKTFHMVTVSPTQEALARAVLNRPPEVRFYQIMPGMKGTTDTVFRLYAKGVDPDEDPLTYAWDLSDGSRYDIQNIAHRFEMPGFYTIDLQASDGEFTGQAQTTLQIFESVLALRQEELLAPKVVKVIDGGENIHEILIGAPEEKIFFEKSNGTTISVEIAAKPGTPPVLEITDPIAVHQKIPLTDMEEPVVITSLDGEPEEIVVVLEEVILEEAIPEEVLPEEALMVEVVKIIDGGENIHEIVVGAPEKIISFEKEDETMIPVEVLVKPGDPPLLVVTDPMEVHQEIPLIEEIEPVMITSLDGEVQALRVSLEEVASEEEVLVESVEAPLMSSVKIIDTSEKSHEVLLDSIPANITLLDEEADPFTIGVRGIAEPTPSVQMVDGQGKAQLIPLDKPFQLVTIQDTSGRALALEILRPDGEAEVSHEPLFITFKDSQGGIHTIPLDDRYHVLSVYDVSGQSIVIQAKASVGPPRVLTIIDPNGSMQNILITEIPQVIDIPTNTEYVVSLRTTEAEESTKSVGSLEGADGLLEKRRTQTDDAIAEIKSSFDVEVTSDQLRNMRAHKKQKADALLDKYKRKVLISDISLIDQALIMFRIIEQAGEANQTGDPKGLNLEIIKNQLLIAKEERDDLLLKEHNMKGTVSTRLNRELVRLNALLAMIERDREVEKKSHPLVVQIPREDPVDQLEQQKAQKENEIQQAQEARDFEKVVVLQEKIVTLDSQLEVVRAAQPPPSAQKVKRRLEKEKARLVAPRKQLEKRKVSLVKAKGALGGEKKEIETVFEKEAETILNEIEPSENLALTTKVTDLNVQIQEVDQEVAKIEEQIVVIDQQVEKIEEQIVEEEKKIREVINICKNPIAANPLFLKKELLEQKEDKKNQQRGVEGREAKQRLQLEIDRLEVQAKGVLVVNNRKEPCLDARTINPFLLKRQLQEINEKKKMALESVKDAESKKLLENDRSRLEAQIKRLTAILNTAQVNLIVNERAQISLDAQFGGETSQALFFEWHLGDGRAMIGQNIKFVYLDPGVYEVRLNVSGELTTLNDSITIKVLEKE